MAPNVVQRQRWNDKEWAAYWPTRERVLELVTPSLLAALALGREERVLDIGCGGGRATLAAASETVEGFVVGADLSAPLLELARQRAAEEDVENVEFVQADVQHETIPGRPFDVAMSQFGVMFFDDPIAAFTNVAGQLRPGGRLGFACWQRAEENRWLVSPVIAHLLPAPPPGGPAPGPFSLAEPARVEAILRAAGFVEVAFSDYRSTLEIDKVALVDPVSLRHSGVAEDRLDEALNTVDGYLDTYRQPSGRYAFELAVHLVSASTPVSP